MGYVREKRHFVFKCKKFGELDEKPREIKEIKVETLLFLTIQIIILQY